MNDNLERMTQADMERSRFIHETLQDAQRQLRWMAQDLRFLAKKQDALVEAARALVSYYPPNIEHIKCESESLARYVAATRDALKALGLTAKEVNGE